MSISEKTQLTLYRLVNLIKKLLISYNSVLLIHIYISLYIQGQITIQAYWEHVQGPWPLGGPLQV